MLGSRASFKLHGLAVDFDNRLWSKDARQWILIYPDLRLLVASQALSSSSTSSMISSRSSTSTRWPVAGGGSSGPAAFFSLCFPAACGRCSIRALSPLRRHKSCKWKETVGVCHAALAVNSTCDHNLLSSNSESNSGRLASSSLPSQPVLFLLLLERTF